MATTLQTGDLAPDFTATATDGSTVTLSSFRGKQNVILYFYPKDDTPGCTREACSFRDHVDAFRRSDTVILGVSVDSVASHQQFTKKFQLPFPLLADENKTISRSYGTLGAMGFAQRATFVIGKDGRILKIFPQVQVDGHTAEVLAALGGQEEKGGAQ